MTKVSADHETTMKLLLGSATLPKEESLRYNESVLRSALLATDAAWDAGALTERPIEMCRRILSELETKTAGLRVRKS